MVSKKSKNGKKATSPSNGKPAINPADYPGQWLAWDSARRNVIAVNADLKALLKEVEKLGESDPWVESAPGFQPGFLEEMSKPKEGESENIIDDIKSTIPDAEEWLDTPNIFFWGEKPRDLIGTQGEFHLRQMLRELWSGNFS